jgi:hypothetical protein
MGSVKKVSVLSALCLSVLVSYASAGKLRSFERDATRDRSGRDRRSDRPDPTFDSDDSYIRHGRSGSISDFMFNDLLYLSLIHPGRRSWARVSADSARLGDLTLEPREPGDPLIPFVRFDAAYQDVDSDVEAFDYRVQVGYGPVGVELHQTRYWEQQPPDSLDIYRVYGLYRLSIGNSLEVDVGLGAIVIDGAETNVGFSSTTPILFYPVDWLVAEFRPMWSDIQGSVTQEYGVALLLNWGYVALRGGYRWTHSPMESLDGPFVGFSVRY